MRSLHTLLLLLAACSGAAQTIEPAPVRVADADEGADTAPEPPAGDPAASPCPRVLAEGEEVWQWSCPMHPSVGGPPHSTCSVCGVDLFDGPPAPADVAAIPAYATRTPSGLATCVMRPGSGRRPSVADRVRVHYVGFKLDGTTFDSSVQRGEPATFPLGGVIPGWTEALQLMAEGEVRTIWVPEPLAYAGRLGAPEGMLVFTVELIAVER